MSLENSSNSEAHGVRSSRCTISHLGTLEGWCRAFWVRLGRAVVDRALFMATRTLWRRQAISLSEVSVVSRFLTSEAMPSAVYDPLPMQKLDRTEGRRKGAGWRDDRRMIRLLLGRGPCLESLKSLDR